ncbi:hypothetical protein Hypma_008048 [Hypsizygus marmoreus]|uniref:Uncharacterized protein n=1 Tax=Hypsizygus marmoreus TaxID=39966 RepID=A0A369JX20_HYPMA|nr:hypothetical protein Hypma_008048 [Hypsizygus marmoreus]
MVPGIHGQEASNTSNMIEVTCEIRLILIAAVVVLGSVDAVSGDMESPLPSVLPMPRLRLSRHTNLLDPASAGTSSNHLTDTPVAPVRNLNQEFDLDGDEDEQPTPRMTATATLHDIAETPAARLRALLSRTPVSSKPAPVPHPPPLSSDYESDFDPPNGINSTAPSFARESLKDIFSRALREPGNTPQKERSRPRRNSIDTSEVEASPRVQLERSKNKGKRRSLSDEEIENSYKSSRRSETSSRSSQAATFDLLRERLTNSHTQIKDQHLSEAMYDDTIPGNDSNDTATFLRDLNASTATPPAATSTPQQSLRMSTNSQLQFQSNLMDQDSEMQRAIEGFDSYEADGQSQRPVSSPSSRQPVPDARQGPPSPQDPRRSQSSLSISHKKSQSLEGFRGPLVRRVSEDLRSSSRTSSSHSGTSSHIDEQDRIREREREWNKPKTPNRSHTPELQHQSSHGRFSRSGSPAVGAPNRHTLSRQGSSNSLHSFDGASSRGSSFGSQAEYRERLAELERERNLERERDWNKRHPKVTRPTSSLSMHSSPGTDRPRTQSLANMSRPDSTQLLTPDRSLHRHHSYTHSSRATSPALSTTASHDGKLDSEEEEIVHERERNWNAPRPKWGQHEHSYRLGSPSQSYSPSGRPRAESLKSPVADGEAPGHRGQTPAQVASFRVNGVHGESNSTLPPRPLSPLPPAKTSASPRHGHHPSSPAQIPPPHSPLPPLSSTTAKGKAPEKSSLSNKPNVPSTDKSQTPSGSRPAYSFMRNRTPLPPLELEKETPERLPPSVKSIPPPSPSPTPGVRPSSRTSGTPKHSGIPVRSPKKSQALSKSNNAHPKVVDERSHTESPKSDPPPRTATIHSMHDVEEERSQPYYDINDHDEGDLAQEMTPTLRTIPPPPVEAFETPPPRSPSPLRQKTAADDENRLQKALATNSASMPLGPIDINTDSSVIQELSPPPSPSVELPAPSVSHSLLSTPPRRPSFNASRVEFQTPSPPKGLPALPGPPTSSEDEGGEPLRAHMPVRELPSDLTALKTPRPPGAWASTPAPPRIEQRPRLPSEEETEPENEHLLTPARNVHPDLTAAKTPRPPGAWASTPAPPTRQFTAQARLSSEDEHDSGLATPVASLSRASSLPPQTPWPPGAWMPTPRKSILKVRFDSHGSLSVEDSSKDVSGDNVDASVETEGPPSTSWNEDVTPRAVTPEPPTPVSPTARDIRSPSRKAPGIRVLDAFGREVPKQRVNNDALGMNSTPRSKSGIRVVDAMGRDVNEVDETVQQSADLTERDEPSVLLNRNEALVRVRQGLSDLASGLDDLDRANNDARLDYTRLGALNDVSRAARVTRQQLSDTLSSNEASLRDKLEPFRASMKKGKLFIPAVVDRRLSLFHTNSGLFWIALVLQVVLILIMYRVLVTKARDLFLTTYYDPFYPDLHLYTSRPDTLRHSMVSSSGTPWLSIPNTLLHEGWKSFTVQVWENLAIIIGSWQQLLWESLGSDDTPQIASWPPT